ncbi:MAG: LamG-like jellyroll fold domain-containing protein [Candidatus Baldrarchaeota archaeon]
MRPYLRPGIIENYACAVHLVYDNIQNKWIDVSGKGNHATITGAVKRDTTNGEVLAFDGVDDYVELPFAITQKINAVDKYSHVIWVKSRGINTGRMLIGVQSPYDARDYIGITKNSDGTLVWSMGIGNKAWSKDTSTAELETDEWYLIVKTVDKTTTTAKLYKNVQLCEVKTGWNWTDPIKTYSLAAYHFDDGTFRSFHKCFIDEYALIVGKLLTLKDIENIYWEGIRKRWG